MVVVEVMVEEGVMAVVVGVKAVVEEVIFKVEEEVAKDQQNHKIISIIVKLLPSKLLLSYIVFSISIVIKKKNFLN